MSYHQAYLVRTVPRKTTTYVAVQPSTVYKPAALSDFWGGLAIGALFVGPLVWTLAGRAFAKGVVGRVTKYIGK